MCLFVTIITTTYSHHENSKHDNSALLVLVPLHCLVNGTVNESIDAAVWLVKLLFLK